MLSIPHLIIIFVVALIVFGPEKLPELARNLGKVMAEFRRATGDLRTTFEGHLRDLERETDRRPPAEAPPAQQATGPEVIAASGTVPANPPHAPAPGSPAGENPAGAAPREPDTPRESDTPQLEASGEKDNDGGARPT